MSASPSVTCPVCQRTSHCRHDIDQSFCGACHIWWKLDPDAPAGYVIVDREEVPGAGEKRVGMMSDEEFQEVMKRMRELSGGKSTLGYYILDAEHRVVSLEDEDTLRWAKWMHEHSDECVVKMEELLGPVFLSTLFLGVDMDTFRFMRHPQAPPLAFETMAFAPPEPGERIPRIVGQLRAHTWEEAEVNHDELRKRLLGAANG